MAGAAQAAENLQQKLSDHFHFRQESRAEMLTYVERQRITFIQLELTLVTLEWAFDAVGKRSYG